ncbi:CaiB/BaiF CoA transferase family protein [Nitratireductor indicus]|uniref:CaiB/BaiF CoA transferase family protein n=1 Tax=Nitratireductor indicus TaxID=721133 RepID=UPI002876CFF1|nr:CoA transferase [Nitratireductor indicus]MDS1136162.1 CoA transferase [Nitratireductor indicus]
MQNILDDITVLDFSRVFAGPAATQVLGDMGANVIKIEPPAGDEARYYGVTKEKLAELGGVSPSFLALNRNKRSLTLDLRNEKGNRIARELADRADVVVHNFRPGVMERLGLGFDTLSQSNGRLVYAEFSAYGRKGPLAHIGANDLALQAHSGLISITGEPDRPPVRCGTAIVDLHGSLALVAGILGALLHRHKTGRGQRVESSLLLSSAHLMSYFYTEYWMDGTVRKPMGTANHLSVPNQAFPARDGEVVIIASTDEMWKKFAHAIDADTLDLPKFARVFDRRQNRVELIAAVSALTTQMTCAEIIDRLGEAKVVVAKVNSVGEAADSEQLEAVDGKIMLQAGAHEFPSVASPFQFSEVDINAAKSPPSLGANTHDILHELGYDSATINSLSNAGAFGRLPEAAE